MRLVNLVADLDWSVAEKAQLKSFGEYVQLPATPKTEAELIAGLRDADYAIISPLPGVRISHQVFEQTPKLKGISLITTWYYWVDTKAAEKHGVIVSNLGGYSQVSVAELAMTMIFALARKINLCASRTKAGKERYPGLMGFELRGKVLGVIGMGSIGSYIAQMGHGLGMRVIGYNRKSQINSVPLVPIEKLLQQADVIAVSLALNEYTENFLSDEKLSLLKSQAIVVNISREGLIDQEAIYELLVNNKIGGYAFELDEPRKTSIKEELLLLDNVIATPYTGWYTFEALQKLTQTAIDNILAMIEERPINVVNESQ